MAPEIPATSDHHWRPARFAWARLGIPLHHQKSLKRLLWGDLATRAGWWLVIWLAGSWLFWWLAHDTGAVVNTITLQPTSQAWTKLFVNFIHRLSINGWPINGWLVGVWVLAVPYIFLRRARPKGYDTSTAWRACWLIWAALFCLWWMSGAWTVTPKRPSDFNIFLFNRPTFFYMTLLGHMTTLYLFAPSWKMVASTLTVGYLLPVTVLAYGPSELQEGQIRVLVNWLVWQTIAYLLVGLFLFRDQIKLHLRNLRLEEQRAIAEEQRTLAEDQRLMAEEQRLMAEKAAQDKTTFIASISHDLRQPLGALTFLLDLLEGETRGNPTATKLAIDAQHQNFAIVNMVDGALDLARLEAGTYEVHPREIALPQLVNDVVNRLRAAAQEKHLSIAVHTLPVVVRSDDAALTRILQNLIVNALRYTPPRADHLDEDSPPIPDVVVECQKHDDYVRISVVDRGIGIPEDRLQDIFKDYVQLDNVARDRTKGLGLGLAIVQRLTGLLNHKIEVDSTVGKGSRFSVLVPYLSNIPRELLPDQGPSEPPQDAVLTGMCIAIVEDNEGVRSSLATWLRNRECTVVEADSASSATEQLKARALRPDFIIADYDLPNGLTGIEAVAEIRHLAGESVPAAIWTGITDPAKIKNIAAHGLAHIKKPTEPAEIHALLAAHWSHSTATENSVNKPTLAEEYGDG